MSTKESLIWDDERRHKSSSSTCVMADARIPSVRNSYIDARACANSTRLRPSLLSGANIDVSAFHQFEHGSETHVWNRTVCVVHVDRNAVATVIDESEGVGCQDDGSLQCRDTHKEQSEHIGSMVLERPIGGA